MLKIVLQQIDFIDVFNKRVRKMLEDSNGKLQLSIDNITEEGFVKKRIMARTIYPLALLFQEN